MDDYYKIVKHPICLSDIERKLEGDEYMTVVELVRDLDLMFHNCKLCTPPVQHQRVRFRTGVNHTSSRFTFIRQQA